MLTLDDDANSGEAARGVEWHGREGGRKVGFCQTPTHIDNPCPLGMMKRPERLQQQRQAGQHLRKASQHTRNTTKGEISCRCLQ